LGLGKLDFRQAAAKRYFRGTFILIIKMGAADIINPNGGISPVTGKSAYIGPDPDLVTHLYGSVALL
jgi:hypothetical protein